MTHRVVDGHGCLLERELVRDQAREAVVLMTFSAFTSLALATALLVITRLGQQG